ncbi:MAG: calcium-binding protein [Proteobacteria bacterium]|nr:calcium-binding protein [Pseudomonadota bacterium]MCP4919582.1 calcium-binding protein [Pseudomonadota bacterium]
MTIAGEGTFDFSDDDCDPGGTDVCSDVPPGPQEIDHYVSCDLAGESNWASYLFGESPSSSWQFYGINADNDEFCCEITPTGLTYTVELFGDENANTIHLSNGDFGDIGKPGSIEVFGGDGDDRVEGTTHSGATQKYRGEGDDDTIFLKSGATAYGGSGYDDFVGSADADVMYGGGGVDRMCGEGGNDSLNGGNDNDELVGGAGVDALNGGAGTDGCEGETEVFCEDPPDDICG